MILVFGGTTEGRKAAEVLEEAGSPYFYSTKTGEQALTLHNGQHIDGAMDGEAMRSFCQSRQIRLIVDAAHPFASQLHETIAAVASSLGIPVVRYDRIYPPRDPDITWIDDYTQVPTDVHTLLATTGVQSISKLKWLEAQGVKIVEYSDATKGWFDMYPGTEPGLTIRPALVRDGHVLARGQATERIV